VFRARAFDSQERLLLLPPVLAWLADHGLGSVDAGGTLLSGGPGKGSVRVTVGSVTGTAPVEVAEVAPRALEDFESAGAWRSESTPAGLPGAASVAAGPARSGSRVLRIEYDFAGGTGTRAMTAIRSIPLGRPFALKVWAYGDGQGAWLRARVRDAAGAVHTLDLARRVDWKDEWRELRAPVSDDLPTPLTFEAIYLVEPSAARKPRGTVLLDDLSVE
jgi:hypothetical protein